MGWHTPKSLNDWTWPDDQWTLLGYKRWYQPIMGQSKLLEAFYNTPNPSTTLPPCPPPNGHWHMTWSHKGNATWSEWHDAALVEETQLYLKGCRTGPKGEFQTNGKGKFHTKGKIKAKGKTTGK